MEPDGEVTTSVGVRFPYLTVELQSVILTEIDPVVVSGGGVVRLKFSVLVPSV